MTIDDRATPRRQLERADLLAGGGIGQARALDGAEEEGAPCRQEQEREERGEEEADAALEQRHRLALAARGSACAARDGGRTRRGRRGVLRRGVLRRGGVGGRRRGARRRRGGGVRR